MKKVKLEVINCWYNELKSLRSRSLEKLGRSNPNVEEVFEVFWKYWDEDIQFGMLNF